MIFKAFIPLVAAGFALSANASTASAFEHGCEHDAGECYEKVERPAVYADVERPVVVAPGRRETVVVPPVVVSRAHRVEVAPQRVYRHEEPAVYTTLTRSKLVRPAETRFVYQPPVTRRVTETVVADPGGVRWERTIGRDGRERLCKVVVPPVHRTVVRDVIVAPAQRVPVTTPAVYRDVAVPVLVKPARVRHEVVPAQYAFGYRPVVVKPAEVHVVEHPPVIAMERQRVLVRPASAGWQRVGGDRW